MTCCLLLPTFLRAITNTNLVFRDYGMRGVFDWTAIESSLKFYQLLTILALFDPLIDIIQKLLTAIVSFHQLIKLLCVS